MSTPQADELKRQKKVEKALKRRQALAQAMRKEVRKFYSIVKGKPVKNG
jgi:hypothetical protein